MFNNLIYTKKGITIKNISINSILKFIFSTVLLTIIGGTICLALVKGNVFGELNNTFYILGLVFSAGGVFSAISGNPVEASMQGLGQNKEVIGTSYL